MTEPEATSEASTGLVSVPLEGEVVAAETVPETFEGSTITEWEVRFPSTVVDSDRSFKRGSIIRLAIQARVPSVSYVEKSDGTLVRSHRLSIEDISVISAFDPSENKENVGGSLSGSAMTQLDDADADNPVSELTGGRTQDLWPPAQN